MKKNSEYEKQLREKGMLDKRDKAVRADRDITVYMKKERARRLKKSFNWNDKSYPQPCGIDNNVDMC